ncbi:MAG: PEP-CTERM sorting domain-containing protein [Crocosphaera sp.]|nr:PEP-CTERM sorting domain-containing protein [Crocosphaera sp.]
MLKQFISFGGLLGLTLFGGSSLAVTVDFTDWSLSGDVITNSMGGASTSSNGLFLDDIAFGPDSDFNFSNNPAIDSLDLEADLGVSTTLDPDPDNFIQATEGSGLTEVLTFSETTRFSFDWTFLTNDETFIETDPITGEDFAFDDYSFIVVDGEVVPIAGTFSALSSSPSNYQQEISGRFSRLFLPGSYQIGLGVVDVGDFENSSALIVENAEVDPVLVPEPNTILGLLMLGLLGTKLAVKAK